LLQLRAHMYDPVSSSESYGGLTPAPAMQAAKPRLSD
jgi:hypothetical protein